MSGPPTTHPPLTMAEAARRSTLSARFLRDEAKRGHLPVIRAGRLLRVRPEDLADYLEDRRAPRREAPRAGA